MKKLIKFGQPTCVPCNMLSNFLKDNEVEYVDVNVHEDVETANKYGITSVPVLVLEIDGVVEEMVFGYNVPEIEELLEKM